MALTDANIIVHRTNLACCSLGALADMVKAQKYGDTKCADASRNMWLWLLWAKSVADRTPITGEDFNKCLTPAFAEAVFKKADCFCDSCGCGPSSTTYPPVDPCLRTATYTALAAVDVDQKTAIESGPPAVGDSYYIVTDSGGTWGSGINSIQTWNGTGWDEVIPSAGQYTDVAGTLWTVTSLLIPGLADPTVTATWIGPPDLYFLQSDYPIIAAASTRQAIAQVFGMGGWVNIFVGPESDLASPFPFNITGYQMDNIAVVYTTAAGCAYPAGGGIMPPGCVFPRDHSCTSHSTISHS